MANSCSTDHHCKFNNNIVLMFQNVNTKNPRYSRYCPNIKSRISPQSLKNGPPILQITRNSPTIFDLNNEKWNPLNSQRITRKSLNSPPLAMNHANFARFLLNSINPCSPTVPQLFTAKFREIRSPRKDSERLTRN